MTNRNGIVLMGAAIALLGYAIIYAAMSHISDSFACGPVSIIQALTPGFTPSGIVPPGTGPAGSHPEQKYRGKPIRPIPDPSCVPPNCYTA